MRRLLAASLAASMFVAAGAASAQNGKGRNPQGGEQFTVGDCISDGFFGNEPNIVGPFAPGGPSEQEPGTKGGRVVPTQSPGPFVNNPADPNNPRFGATGGDANRFFRTTGTFKNLADFCQTLDVD